MQLVATSHYLTSLTIMGLMDGLSMDDNNCHHDSKQENFSLQSDFPWEYISI
jgi:hypothetical protein